MSKQRTNFAILLLLVPLIGEAFWVVNFGTARPLPPGKIGFAAGMGGQVVFLGTPHRTSAFFTIPHAGFRFGIFSRIDAGIRLAPIPLPFSTVGPGFGVNLDGKMCLTEPGKKVDAAVILGFGGAHVHIEGHSRYAYSPNAAALVTYNLSESTHITGMARFVNLAIPTAPLGSASNYVNITGLSIGLKTQIAPNISLLPEIGAYWYAGKIAAVAKNGPGFQIGLMLATTF